MYRLLWPVCVKLAPPMYKRFWRISKPHICSETSPSIYILISVLLWCWLPLALWLSVIAYLRGDTLSSVQVFIPRPSKYLPGQPFSFLKFQSHVTLIQGWWLNWNVLYCEEATWWTHSFYLSLQTHTHIHTHTHTCSFCIYNFYIQFKYVNIYSLYIKYMCI